MSWAFLWYQRGEGAATGGAEFELLLEAVEFEIELEGRAT